jgi:hypothetical protein
MPRLEFLSLAVRVEDQDKTPFTVSLPMLRTIKLFYNQIFDYMTWDTPQLHSIAFHDSQIVDPGLLPSLSGFTQTVRHVIHNCMYGSSSDALSHFAGLEVLVRGDLACRGACAFQGQCNSMRQVGVCFDEAWSDFGSWIQPREAVNDLQRSLSGAHDGARRIMARMGEGAAWPWDTTRRLAGSHRPKQSQTPEQSRMILVTDTLP